MPRVFNAAFTTEKNKRDQGPAPRNLLEFGFATPVKLSDSDVTVPGWDGINLVTNGDMELDYGWPDSGDFVTSNTRENTQAHGGTYSRKLVVGRGAGGIKHTGDRFTTSTGSRYRVTTKLYRSADTSPVHVTVRNGADTADILSVDSSALSLDAWTSFSQEYTETAGGSQAFVTVTAESGTTTYIDNIVVEIETYTYGSDLLVNGDMELDSDYSGIGPTLVSQVRSSTEVAEGTYSRYLDGGATWGGMENDNNFSLTSGTNYRLTGQIFRSNVSAGFSVGLARVKAGDGTTTALTGQIDIVTDDVWQPFEFIFDGTVSGANGVLSLEGWDIFTGYYDDVKLQEQILGWSGINLVPNGDMELDSGWEDSGDLVVTNERSSEQVYAGTYSRKLVVAAVSSGITDSANTFTTVTGSTCRIGFWLYRLADTSPVEVIVRNGAGTADVLTESTVVTLGAWQYISHEYTETAGGDQAFVTINANQDTTSYIDDVVVETQLKVLQYAGLVKSWGFVDSSGGQVPGRSIIGQIESSDLALTIINSQSPRFSDNSTAADPIEGVVVTLYQWFVGTDLSEKEPIFVGVVRGQPQYDELEYRLTVKGIWNKYNRVIGNDLILSPDDFPDIDLEDIGRMANIAYGSLVNIRCPAIDSGAVDNLFAAINETQNTLELSDAGRFPTSGMLGCELEEMTYTGNNGKILTGVTRGVNGTTAAAHDAAMVCWEIASEFVYQLASHPIKTAYELFVDDFRITDIAIFYTGQTGDEKVGFEGMAVAVIPARITRAAAVDLLVNDGLTINDAIDVVDTIGVYDTIGVSDTILVDDTIDVSDTIAVSDLINVDDTIAVSTGNHSHTGGNIDTIVWKFDYGVSTGASSVSDTVLQGTIDGDFNPSWLYGSSNQQAKFYKATYQDYEGTPYRYRICVALGDIPTTGEMTLSMNGGGGSIAVDSGDANTTKKGVWTSVPAALDTWAEWNAQYGLINMDVSGNVYVKDFWIEIEITPPAPASAATGVAKSGSASKTGAATKTGSASKSGAASKIGAASKTGTAAKSGAASKGGTVTREGAVTLTGNSVADVEVGTLITANFDGWRDDATGTVTGTPYALLERPDHVIKHLLTYYCEYPAANIGNSFATSGAFYNINSYSFALLINQPISADNLLMKLALQSRSRFFVSPVGVAQLIVRQLGQVSGHAIPKAEIKQGSMSIRRSAENDIVNTFNILWQRDWRLSGPDAYQGATAFTDATSVGSYGVREPARAELFHFDAVIVSAMVDHVGAYWLSFQKDSRKLPSFSVFLDNMETEPGDIIDLTYPLDNMAGFVCEVLKIRHVPGSAKRNIIDHLEILAVEN
ncbi:MAG: hypothetical protein ABFS18_02190 [Thermodesulfobacteriota bacterium]